MAFGAFGLATAILATERLGRLDDLVRAQATRAHANALDAPVDHRANLLKVWLEATRTDVMRMTHLPAHDRRLPANCTLLRHDSSVLPRQNHKYSGRSRLYQAMSFRRPRK